MPSILQNAHLAGSEKGKVTGEHGCRLMCLEGQPSKISGYLFVCGSHNCARVTKKLYIILAKTNLASPNAPNWTVAPWIYVPRPNGWACLSMSVPNHSSPDVPAKLSLILLLMISSFFIVVNAKCFLTRKSPTRFHKKELFPNNITVSRKSSHVLMTLLEGESKK